MKLTPKEKQQLEDYLKFIEISPQTLANHILKLVLDRHKIGNHQKIENYARQILAEQPLDLEDYIELIEELDIEEITYSISEILGDNKWTQEKYYKYY